MLIYYDLAHVLHSKHHLKLMVESIYGLQTELELLQSAQDSRFSLAHSGKIYSEQKANCGE